MRQLTAEFHGKCAYCESSGSSSHLVRDSISDFKRIIFKLEKAQRAARDLTKYCIIYRFSPKVTMNQSSGHFFRFKMANGFAQKCLLGLF
jgi:hypothetical protein